MKFDYEYPQRLSASFLPENSVKGSELVGQRAQSKVSGNLFSCMDRPNYERDFELVPKVIRKY